MNPVTAKEKAPTGETVKATKNSNREDIVPTMPNENATAAASLAPDDAGPLRGNKTVQLARLAFEAAARTPSQPNGWSTNEDGSRSFTTDYGATFTRSVLGMSYTAKDSAAPLPICGPLEVLGEVSSEDGEDLRLLVRWEDRKGRAHEDLFQRGMLRTGINAVITRLANGGLKFRYPVRQDSSGNNYVVDYLAQWPDPTEMRGVRVTGWAELGRVFVLPDGRVVGTPSDGMRRVFTGEVTEDVRTVYRPRGTLHDWQMKVAAPITKSTTGAFGLCIGFATPLMEFVGEPSGGFNFFGNSSKGKSTGLKATCSVWACADDKGGDAGTWRNTDNGIEALAAARSDLPLLMDELGQADAKVLRPAVYMLANGSGKGRMGKNGGLRTRLTWRTMPVSAGELTIAEYAEKVREKLPPGVFVRMVDIPAVPNPEDPRGAFDLAEAGTDVKALTEDLGRAVNAEAYGTAGPEFIRKLIEDVEARGGVEAFRAFAVERVKDIRRQLLESRSQFEQEDSQVGRIARRFALVALAGSLAVRYGILSPECGWTEAAPLFYAMKCLERALQRFQTTEGRAAALIQRLDEHRTANRAHFSFYVTAGPNGGAFQGAELSPVYGFVSEQANTLPGFEKWGRTAFYLPVMFKEVVCPPGEADETLKALYARGRLRTNNGKDRRGNTRLYCVVRPGENHPLGLRPGNYYAVRLDEQPIKNDR